MDLIKLKYVGGRSFVKNVYARKSYVFKQVTNFECEVPRELAKDLLITGQYMPVDKVVEILKEENNNPLVCEECGFIAKSDFGILAHKRKHLKKE